MQKFSDVLRARKLNIDGKKIKIAVLGNVSTQFFSQAIEGNCKLSGINAELYDADYNQIDLLLIDKKSDVYLFNPNFIILWISSRKLYEEFLNLNINERNKFADEYILKIKQYWESIKNYSNASIIQLDFCNIVDRALGNYSNKVDSTFSYQIKKLNYLLNEKMKETTGVFPVSVQDVQSMIGNNQMYDPVLYYNSKMSLSFNALTYVSQMVVDVIKSINGKIKKCLIMDLDNTIWGGIIGDDGLEKIEIGELGRGHAFSTLQKWIKQLKECGIILAVCSKNNEEIAKTPFEKHPDMVLRLSDISIFVANWNDKVSNIKLIQETLNIGMDSIVFIDDNPFERNLVKKMIPEITVPDLPEDPSKYLDFLVEQNLFEVASFAISNSDRTSQYQAQYERKKMETQFSSIDDYLKSLEMVCEANHFDESMFPRIAQLSQRSNQFNLRTIRYTDDEVKRLSERDDYITLMCNLKDKFGDYGLVSVVVIKKTKEDEGFIENWLMSCRALKRGLEEFTINKVISLCKECGINRLNAEYVPTSKNMMVKNIYKEFGFLEKSINEYTIIVSEYKEKLNFIKEV